MPPLPVLLTVHDTCQDTHRGSCNVARLGITPLHEPDSGPRMFHMLLADMDSRNAPELDRSSFQRDGTSSSPGQRSFSGCTCVAKSYRFTIACSSPSCANKEPGLFDASCACVINHYSSSATCSASLCKNRKETFGVVCSCFRETFAASKNMLLPFVCQWAWVFWTHE